MSQEEIDVGVKFLSGSETLGGSFHLLFYSIFGIKSIVRTKFKMLVQENSETGNHVKFRII